MEDIKIPSRRFYNNKHYFLDYENKVLRVEENILKEMQSNKPGTFKGFKKITGSALSNILKLTSFDSQFKGFVNICRFDMPIINTMYVDAGKAVEPKVIERIQSKFDEVIQRFEAEQYNYDYFKSNELFGGLPDGYVENQKLIIEIKTVGEKNLEKWTTNGVTPGYIKQAQLYTYLMGAKKFTIVGCFLKKKIMIILN
ncbi:MAGa7180 family putative nuclease [Mycoplasma struthionis]|uniref:MAGa7180 family putative nuclease n=1 Tax=Mycoplasma struthionis TaxID=538220 RepID=UPI001FE4AB87|nr:hypothetical protein [Mycoplasma struthionis]